MQTYLGYMRVSRVGDRAERLISPELQEERIKGYAAARGLKVEMLEPELDVSGGKVDRPILSQAIAAIERKEAAGIIVAQLDRLSRMDIVDALQTIRRIEAAGAQVIAVAENFDAGTPEGKMGRNVFLAMGEMQLDRYKAQFRSAKARAVREGIWPIPVVPVGYEKGANRKLKPSDKAAAVIEAFERRASGASWRLVAQPLGKGLTGARKVILNRVYLGEIHYGEWQNLKAHPAIVSRDLWEAAQIYHPPPPRSRAKPALLAGLVRCAGCGYRMSVDSVTGPGIYKCRPHKATGRCPAPAISSMKRLDAIVRRSVLGQLKSVSFSASARNDALGEAEAKLEAAEAELSLFQRVTQVTEVGAEHFAEGLQHRTGEVESARKGLAQARLSTPVLPHGSDLENLDSDSERALLRGALGVVWVRKDHKRAGVRIIAAGFEPSEFGPIDWVDVDLPGEIRVLES